jgi:hypothetical protein
MSRNLHVDLFAEDQAHEEFLDPLIARIAREENVEISTRVRSARGGHARAIAEFKLYQSFLVRGLMTAKPPDLIVVAIDGNCTTFARKREEIEAARDDGLSASIVAACPDPHVERWYLADPPSFHSVVGFQPVVGRAKCERGHYKALLSDAVVRGGHPPTLGGIEFAMELAEAIDLFRAGKADPSFRAFVVDLQKALRRLTAAEHEEA